jgi:hypothetical protein
MFIQPNLVCLLREVRTYYTRGRWTKCIYTMRNAEFGLNAEGKQFQAPGSDDVMNIDFGTNTGDKIMREAFIAVPAITSKIHHLMKILQQWNYLISDSGVIRFDFGFEMLPVGSVQNYGDKVATDDIEAAELEACCLQSIPEQWSSTGRGWIVRAFLNEVAASAHMATVEMSVLR